MDAEPVGIVEIAERMEVTRDTVNKWRERPAVAFPDARWTVGGRPAWDWQQDIVPWATSTGRVMAAALAGLVKLACGCNVDPTHLDGDTAGTKVQCPTCRKRTTVVGPSAEANGWG